MAASTLPDGFGWVWVDDTVRVNLPWFVRTASHVLEPMLTTGDAERLADAIVEHERGRRDQRQHALRRMILAHDPRYSEDTLARFRSKLSIALVERGKAIAIDEMVTMTGLDAESEDRRTAK